MQAPYQVEVLYLLDTAWVTTNTSADKSVVEGYTYTVLYNVGTFSPFLDLWEGKSNGATHQWGA